MDEWLSLALLLGKILADSFSEIFSSVFIAQSQILEWKELLDSFECSALILTAHVLLAEF